MDSESFDLNSPSGRQALLESIPPDRAIVARHHQLLLRVFQHEMDYRVAAVVEEETNHFEQLYWCGLLLYLVGDPTDVPLMWRAKHINMDTGCGFDGQFLVGAGVDRTLKYLESNGHSEIANYIRDLGSYEELDNPVEWENFRIEYFYGNED